MQVSLLDAVTSVWLNQAGITPPTQGQTGVQGADTYAPSSSTLTQLSGYGQLLNATSQFATNLAAATINNPSTPQAAASTSPTVATATFSAGAPSSVYSLNVTQAAKSQTLSSSYFSDPNATIFNLGALTLQTGSLNSNGVFQSDSSSPTTINITTPTLTGVANAINASGAPVTASVVNNSYGYQLQITDNTTGVGNNFQLTSANPGPLDGGQQTLNTLSLSQTQAAQNASYSVNGGATQTSSGNSVAIDTGVNATLVGAGTTSIVAGSGSTTAQNAVNAYNALQGDVATLTSSTGVLNGNTATATQLSTDLQSALQATYSNGSSSLTTLSQLGITQQSPGTPTSALTINSATFQSAYNSDPVGATSLLNKAIQQFTTVANGYTNTANTNASNGIYAQQQSIENQYVSSLLTANPSLNSLSATTLNTFVQDEISQGSNALGLTGFSTYG